MGGAVRKTDEASSSPPPPTEIRPEEPTTTTSTTTTSSPQQLPSSSPASSPHQLSSSSPSSSVSDAPSMKSSAPSASSSSSSPTPSSQPMLEIGTLVHVASRTWPGMNKQGGVGRVTAIHHHRSDNGNDGDGNNNNEIITHVDVKYVVEGGNEKNVPIEYVTVPSSTEASATDSSSSLNGDLTSSSRARRRRGGGDRKTEDSTVTTATTPLAKQRKSGPSSSVNDEKVQVVPVSITESGPLGIQVRKLPTGGICIHTIDDATTHHSSMLRINDVLCHPNTSGRIGLSFAEFVAAVTSEKRPVMFDAVRLLRDDDDDGLNGEVDEEKVASLHQPVGGVAEWHSPTRNGSPLSRKSHRGNEEHAQDDEDLGLGAGVVTTTITSNDDAADATAETKKRKKKRKKVRPIGADASSSDEDDDDENWKPNQKKKKQRKQKSTVSRTPPGYVDVDNDYYVTRNNDTIHTVSQMLGCSWQSLVEVNADRNFGVTLRKYTKFRSKTYLAIPPVAPTASAATAEEYEEWLDSVEEGGGVGVDYCDPIKVERIRHRPEEEVSTLLKNAAATTTNGRGGGGATGTATTNGGGEGGNGVVDETMKEPSDDANDDDDNVVYEEAPPPGKICRDAVYYCTRNDDTPTIVASLLGCKNGWRDVANANKHRFGRTTLTPAIRFEEETYLRLPSIDKCDKFKVAHLIHRSDRAERGSDVGHEHKLDMCVECQQLEKPDDPADGPMLLCDGCDNACHLRCAPGNLTVVPDEDWYCGSCQDRGSSPPSAPRAEKEQSRLVVDGGNFGENAVSSPSSIGGVEEGDDGSSPASLYRRLGAHLSARRDEKGLGAAVAQDSDDQQLQQVSPSSPGSSSATDHDVSSYRLLGRVTITNPSDVIALNRLRRPVERLVFLPLWDKKTKVAVGRGDGEGKSTNDYDLQVFETYAVFAQPGRLFDADDTTHGGMNAHVAKALRRLLGLLAESYCKAVEFQVTNDGGAPSSPASSVEAAEASSSTSSPLPRTPSSGLDENGEGKVQDSPGYDLTCLVDGSFRSDEKDPLGHHSKGLVADDDVCTLRSIQETSLRWMLGMTVARNLD